MPIDFTKYESLELAEEHSFIAYVKKSNQESIAFWQKWIKDHPDQEDKVSEAEALIKSILVEEEELTGEKADQLFARIESSIKEPSQTKVRNLLWIRYAAAAAIILIISLLIFLPSRSIGTVKTNFAQTKEITLPDQSEILLNADSKIVFAKRDWDIKRSVDLEGEAFFSVEKGGKFTVNTSLGSVEVLGTSFNVLNREGYFEVICKTGKVSVTVNELKETEVIEPNQGIFFNLRDNNLVRKIISKEQDILWKEGKIRFEDKPLEFVFNEIERQFKTDITGDVLQEAYTGTVSLSSLDSALYDICWPMKLNYEIKGRRVQIKK